MSDLILTAEQQLLSPVGMNIDQLASSLGYLQGKQFDDGDFYLQKHAVEAWSLEDGIVKDGSFHIDLGVGVRVQSGDKTGFAYSDVISDEAIKRSALAARSIAKHADKPANAGRQVIHRQAGIKPLYRAANPLGSIDEQAKIALLKDIDAYARALDSRIIQVNASLSASHDVVMVLRADGHLAADVRPLVRCNVSVLAEHNGRRERGGSGGGGRLDYQYFLSTDLWREYCDEAVRLALLNLEAQDVPAGTMPVVLGGGWPGVLLHEAVGHGLEGDFNRKGSSTFAGCMGEKVASPLCTVVDDGTIADRRGSLSVDDEGTPSAYNVLIENGVLKSYMQDRMNARLMGVDLTGNGRRESYAHLPMPRMTNTYMLPGQSEPDEIISSLDKGVYAVNFAGGQVDITSGKFVFSMSEAYWVENGKVQYPIKGATLIGSGPEVMQQISMVGNDLQLDAGVGVCGKDGQSVPVGVGQPTLKIDSITVGGTS